MKSRGFAQPYIMYFVLGMDRVIHFSKMATVFASLIAGLLGFVWLKTFRNPNPGDSHMEDMNFICVPTVVPG